MAKQWGKWQEPIALQEHVKFLIDVQLEAFYTNTELYLSD